MPINNRKELSDHLEFVMSSSQKRLEEEGELGYKQNLLKTYLVESSMSDIRNIISPEGYNLQIQQTNDKTLQILKVQKNSKTATFYVDTVNPRYWLIHTVDSYEFTNPFIQKYVSSVMNGLDHLWLPTNFMIELSKKDDTSLIALYILRELAYLALHNLHNETVEFDPDDILKRIHPIWENIHETKKKKLQNRVKDILQSYKKEQLNDHLIKVNGKNSWQITKSMKAFRDRCDKIIEDFVAQKRLGDFNG